MHNQPTMFKPLLSLALLATSITAISITVPTAVDSIPGYLDNINGSLGGIGIPTSLDAITSLISLPPDASLDSIRVLQVNQNLYVAGLNVSWALYHRAVHLVKALFTAGLGAVIEPSNIKEVAAALKEQGFKGEVWVSSFNGDDYLATEESNCMTLDVDTAYFRVYTDPTQCKPEVARPFLISGYAGKLAMESFELEGRQFQFLDLGVSYPIYQFISSLSTDIVPASIDARLLPKLSHYLTTQNYAGAFWIGSWDGNTYESTCMALTLPYAINVYEGGKACTRLRPALYEVVPRA
ncbi:hypothetical protein HDU96_003827 [Phlyctochytrium bullatum]|nr:hypothetical protein HDU96_003827 [Phlyctochytrium bullatum]